MALVPYSHQAIQMVAKVPVYWQCCKDYISEPINQKRFNKWIKNTDLSTVRKNYHCTLVLVMPMSTVYENAYFTS